jgi:hypothetical protein
LRATKRQIPQPFLEVRVHELGLKPPVTAACAGYEAGKWRSSQLASHMVQWLPDFALNHKDLEAIGGHNAVLEVARAAQLVYGTGSGGRRGEPGELLLHIILCQVFKTVPAIRKIFYKDSRNDNVKGFDAVHVIAAGNELELWLGEAKFYGDIKKAVSAVVEELQQHTTVDYLRSEFTLIANKIEDDWPHADQLRRLLDKNTSLDKVFVRACIPVLLTYDSTAVANHKQASEEYKAEFRREVLDHREYFAKQALPRNIRIHLLLLPLKRKDELLHEFDRRLTACQGIQ